MRFIVLLSWLMLTGCEQKLFAERRLISDAKSALREKMRDPDSVKFKDIMACSKPGGIVGKYNAKNGYGAYSGFELFMYRDGVVATVDDWQEYDKLSDQCYSDDVLAETKKIKVEMGFEEIMNEIQ